MTNSNRVKEGRNRLKAREEDGPNVVTISKAKNSLGCREGDAFRDLNCEGINSSCMMRINDDVGVLGVKASRYEVKGVFSGEISGLVEGKIEFEEKFLVVSELKVVWTVELVLHPFGEDELGQMPDVGVSTGSASIVEVKGITFLKFIEYKVHIAVTKVDAPFQEIMELSSMLLDTG